MDGSHTDFERGRAVKDAARTSTAVVGAGIVGATIAYELQKRGRQVTLIDRDAPGRGASWGNMASIAVTEFMPASRPSVWRRIPHWLMDAEGPVRIRPSYMLRLAPWMLRFVMASRPRVLREIEAQGAALCARALDDTTRLMRELGVEGDLSETGCLSLYRDDAELKEDRDHFEILDRFGFRYEMLGSNALRDLEPEISTQIQRAVLFPDNRTLRNPHDLVTAVVARFEALGGAILRADAQGFERSDRITGVRLPAGNVLKTDELVLAAGALTSQFSRQLGDPMPLETERGYHTQIMSPGITLNHSIIWPAKAFMVSPTAGGIRVGGTVEMAGIDAAPDYRRAKITLKRAREALPNLQTEDATEWMGHRPALPDTVPVIAASAKTPGVFYATGHGHLGVTNAATTAHLIGQLMAGETPDIDLRPYRIDRF